VLVTASQRGSGTSCASNFAGGPAAAVSNDVSGFANQRELPARGSPKRERFNSLRLHFEFRGVGRPPGVAALQRFTRGTFTTKTPRPQERSSWASVVVSFCPGETLRRGPIQTDADSTASRITRVWVREIPD